MTTCYAVQYRNTVPESGWDWRVLVKPNTKERAVHHCNKLADSMMQASPEAVSDLPYIEFRAIEYISDDNKIWDVAISSEYSVIHTRSLSARVIEIET